MYMLNLLTKSLKIIPVTLGTFLLVTSGVTATTTEIKIQKTKINTVSPEEALSVLKNRPQLKVPVSQDNIKQFRDTTFSDNMSQVTNISELQDVSPTDWAYEALRSLVERYGCIVGYPDRTFRGNYSASRNEFAAGLNSCLNTIERLLQENVAVLREDIEKGLPFRVFCDSSYSIRCCTSYGATLWDSVVGYGVFPRRFYSDCTDQFLFCQQNNYFLDVNSLSHYY